MTFAAGPRDPEELEAAGDSESGALSALTTLGAVHLTVSQLDRSLVYYRHVVGLEVLEQGRGQASLGAGGQVLLGLVEEAGACPATHRTGLDHFALLLARRADLARWLAHAVRKQVRLAGVADHFVSEALYLSDPDGHGIEIYWDRPRELWEGQVGARMATLPLDVGALLRELAGSANDEYRGLPGDTVMGHIHLKVAAIPETVSFYRDVLGFGMMARLGAEAAFFGAGGYHHHVGANTWESSGASAPPPGAAALRHATILVPDAPERERVLERITNAAHTLQEAGGGPLVRDPSGNALLLALA